jgi:hypothetical protein
MKASFIAEGVSSLGKESQGEIRLASPNIALQDDLILPQRQPLSVKSSPKQLTDAPGEEYKLA